VCAFRLVPAAARRSDGLPQPCRRRSDRASLRNYEAQTNEGESAPMTLGQALDAKVRLIVWCETCQHRAEPAVADQVARDGGDTTVIDWTSRLRCSARDGREVDFVVSGA
jgi:hypothetical protein